MRYANETGSVDVTVSVPPQNIAQASSFLLPDHDGEVVHIATLLHLLKVHKQTVPPSAILCIIDQHDDFRDQVLDWLANDDARRAEEKAA